MKNCKIRLKHTPRRYPKGVVFESWIDILKLHYIDPATISDECEHGDQLEPPIERNHAIVICHVIAHVHDALSDHSGPAGR